MNVYREHDDKRLELLGSTSIKTSSHYVEMWGPIVGANEYRRKFLLETAHVLHPWLGETMILEPGGVLPPCFEAVLMVRCPEQLDGLPILPDWTPVERLKPDPTIQDAGLTIATLNAFAVARLTASEVPR
jgi:hypothetical protein